METTFKKQNMKNMFVLLAALGTIFIAAAIYSSKADEQNQLSMQDQSLTTYSLAGSI